MFGNNTGIYYYVLEYKLYQAENRFSIHFTGITYFSFVLSPGLDLERLT